MPKRNELLETLNALTESEVRQVVQYAAFLKSHRRAEAQTPALNDEQLQARYAEASDEDRSLAEAGLADYGAGLLKEDSTHGPSR